MTKLYPTGHGLSAIVGMNESQVLKIVQAATSDREPVFVANINAPRQIVIAGADTGMDRVLRSSSQPRRQKAERLHVSVPSHCPLLQPVADCLQRGSLLGQLQPPKITYVGEHKRASDADCGSRRERSREQHCARCTLARCRHRTAKELRLQSFSRDAARSRSQRSRTR